MILKDLLLENPEIIQKVARDHENFQNTLIYEYNPHSKVFKMLANLGAGEELKELYTHLSRADDAFQAVIEELHHSGEDDDDME